MTAKNINAIDLMSRALAGMRMADEVPTMPREVIAYLAPFAHLSGDNDAVSFLVEAMQAEADIAEGWISVEDELPELDKSAAFLIGSIDVDVMLRDGTVMRDCWMYIDSDYADENGKWTNANLSTDEYLDVVFWRPMRGDHD